MPDHQQHHPDNHPYILNRATHHEFGTRSDAAGWINSQEDPFDYYTILEQLKKVRDYD